MSGRRSGIVVGGGVAAVGARAHVAAGGSVGPAFAAATAAMTLGALAGRRLRWTFWRALAGAVAVQPLLHLALGAGGDDAHAAHHGVDGAGERMWILHTAAAVGVAVLARWGGRWLRTMPAAARAVALAMAPTGAPSVGPGGPPWARSAAIAPRAVAAVAWTSRGPPSPT